MGKTKYARAFQTHLHLLSGINGSCRVVFFSEQCYAVAGWAILLHNLMLDICLFCELDADLKTMLGSVDDIHGDIFRSVTSSLNVAASKPMALASGT